MLEDLYTKPDLSRKANAQPQEMEKETMTADADDGDRNTPIYDNVTQRSTEDVVEKQQTAASVRVGSGTSVKVLLGLLCFILLVAIIIMATLLILWGQDTSNQQKELLRSLGEMTGNLSQLSSYNHQLKDNYSNLSKKLELFKTEMETMAFNLNATMHDLTANLNATMHNLTKKCPAGWKPFQRSCYLQSSSSQTWDDSRRFCQEHGADLVVISDRPKQLFITSFDVNVWIGVTDAPGGQPRIWKGVNEQQLTETETFWNDNEPNNPIYEHCVALTRGLAVKNWNDARCHLKKVCICEKAIEA